MNAKEITTKLKEIIEEHFEGYLAEFMEIVEINEASVKKSEEEDIAWSSKDRALLTAFGDIEQVMHKRCGSEHDIMRYVYHFKDHDVFLCIDGSYSSWEGTSFDDDWYEVKPYKVTSTKYKRVK